MKAEVEVKARDLEHQDEGIIKVSIAIHPVPPIGDPVARIEVVSAGLTDAGQIRTLLAQVSELMENSNLESHETVKPEPNKARPFNPGATR